MDQQKFKINKLSGFTLIEVIIVVTIFSVLMFVAADLLITIIEKPKAQLNAMSNIDQARFAASTFTNEIRAAAYGTYPLIEASDSEIIFYSPIGASQGSINKIRYYASGQTLYKGVIIPVNGVYNPVTETVSAVLTGLSNGTDPLFFYYDGSYDANGTSLLLICPSSA